jgi:pectinesterase
LSAFERRISVAADASADFRTIGEALASLPPDEAGANSDAAGGGTDGNAAATIISIAAGSYHEKLRVLNRRVSLEGAGRDATIISWDDHALRALPSGEPMGTFNSSTLYVGGEDFRARNLRIENAAGNGRLVGQAVACYVDADRAAFADCSFSARQDTLCLGPLPTNPLPKGLNPVHPVHIAREGDEERPFRHWFKRCRVEGDIDFIFGSSTALFDACDIVSLDRGEKVNGYITAPSTLPGQRYGFVFIDCRIEGETAAGSVFLGQPWRSSAKAAFLRCEMGRHISAAGWDNWDKPENEASVEFVEFGNHGPGAPASGRVPWARVLSGEEAIRFSPEAILSGSDGWEPW